MYCTSLVNSVAPKTLHFLACVERKNIAVPTTNYSQVAVNFATEDCIGSFLNRNGLWVSNLEDLDRLICWTCYNISVLGNTKEVDCTAVYAIFKNGLVRAHIEGIQDPILQPRW